MPAAARWSTASWTTCRSRDVDVVLAVEDAESRSRGDVCRDDVPARDVQQVHRPARHLGELGGAVERVVGRIRRCVDRHEYPCRTSSSPLSQVAGVGLTLSGRCDALTVGCATRRARSAWSAGRGCGGVGTSSVRIDAQQRHRGQDVEDRVQRQARGDQEAAQQRAADAAEPAEPGAPRHRRRRAPSCGSSWPRSRRSGSGCRWCPGRRSRRTAAGGRAGGRREQRDGHRADQEAPRDHGLGTEPVGEPGTDQRADDRPAVEHQQEGQRALGVENPARSSARAARC